MVDSNNKIDIKQLTILQVIKRGQNILNDDEKGISNIIRVLNQDIDVLGEVNKELKR